MLWHRTARSPYPFLLEQVAFEEGIAFLSSLLEKLVKVTTYKDDVKLQDWYEHLKHSNLSEYAKDFDLIAEKGIYPDDWMRSVQRSPTTK